MCRHALLVLVVCIACATPPPLEVDPTLRRALDDALALEQSGDPSGARDRLTAIASSEPGYARAQLALDRLVGEMDGEEAARGRAERLALDRETRPIGLLLLAGHAEGDEREALLREALALRPALTEASVALARHLREAERFDDAIAVLARALDVVPDDVDALVEAAYCHFRTFRWPEACAYAGRAADVDPDEPRALVFEAVNQLIKRNYVGAIKRFRRLRELAPDDASMRRQRAVSLLAYRAQLMRLRSGKHVADGLALAAEASSLFPRSGAMRDMLGYFTELAGDREEAEAHYRAALEIDPYAMRSMQDLRRVLFARGRYLEAVGAWKRLVPMRLILRRDNDLRPRWVALLEASAATPTLDGATPEGLRALARATRAVGWLSESVSIYRRLTDDAGWRARLGEELIAEASEVDAMRRFLVAWRARARQHYKALERKKDTLDLDGLASWIDGHWPSEVRGPKPSLDADLARYYLLVREATPFQRREGSLASALDRFGFVFDAGDNAGYLDMRVMRPLFRARCEQRVDGLTYSYTPLVTDETLIDNYLAYLSGRSRISGRCFLSRRGFYVAIDTFRPSARGVRRFLRRPTGPERTEPVGYSATLDAGLRARFLARLGVAYPVDEADDRLVDRVYHGYVHAYARNVWMHELGHLVDFEKYVPFGERLGANLGVSLSCGFSPSKIVQRFERVAETFSLATTPYPYLCLQDNLDRLELDPSSLFYMVLVAWQKRDPRESPYYLGARSIFDALMGEVDALEEIAGLDAATIRRVARQRCRAEGIPFEAPRD